MKNTKYLVAIDDSLRFLLFGLQYHLGVEFSARESERIFLDEKNNSCTEKSYTLYKDLTLSVTGVVDEYEPETIWILVSGKKVNLEEIEKRARHEIHRMKKTHETQTPSE